MFVFKNCLVSFIIITLLLGVVDCGVKGQNTNIAVGLPKLISEVEIIQHLNRIEVRRQGQNHDQNNNSKFALTPEATEVANGISYVISNCTATQTDGKWRTCCDLQIINNSGNDISGVVLIGWQALSGSPEVVRTGGNNSGYDGSGIDWRTTDGNTLNPGSNGGWVLWLKNTSGGETITDGTISALRRLCLQSPDGYSSSNWKLYKDCPTGRVKESGTNSNLLGWAMLGDTTPDPSYSDLGNGNYVVTDSDGYYVFPEIGASSFIHNAGADCHETLRTVTTDVYIESFVQPGGTDCWLPTATLNAPTGRSLHKAVWSGTTMIIWGGYYFDGSYDQYLNTGGIYSPSTNLWTATTTTDAPSARIFHTAVWTGSEMVIWGGDDGTYTDTGGRYNPSTDSWVSTSTTNAPSGRFCHTAVWTGSEMVIWGGDDGTYTDTGGRYNPSTDSWVATSTTNSPAARFCHTAVWTGTEMIVWGGYDGINYLDTGSRYNPSADSWTTTATTNAPTGRTNHTAVWTGSEMIVWGGYYFDGVNDNYLNTGGRYNPSADSWTTTATTNAPTGRTNHTAVWTPQLYGLAQR